ncbi:hypothetical protein BN130_1365 [Cronobacter malonaticus 507]|nr:hypothetical protein BN130_1365 [Cronobacter malonaticus 507]
MCGAHPGVCERLRVRKKRLQGQMQPVAKAREHAALFHLLKRHQRHTRNNRI